MNVPRIDVIGMPVADVAARSQSRLERDLARGYSINVKQVILAFAVEFVIIGLILANQSAIAAELPNANWMSFIKGTSLPIALAMAELARVPLAIAVRTQPSWNIKLVAVAGVIAAVVVTSVNLSLIGWNTYDPRLGEVNQKHVELLKLQNQKTLLLSQVIEADNAVQQKRNDRDNAYEKQNRLQLQLNAQQNVVPGTNTTTNLNGTKNTKTVFRENPAIPLLKKNWRSLSYKSQPLRQPLSRQKHNVRLIMHASRSWIKKSVPPRRSIARRSTAPSFIHMLPCFLAKIQVS